VVVAPLGNGDESFFSAGLLLYVHGDRLLLVDRESQESRLLVRLSVSSKL
jgi:hypothetical protein